MSKKGYKQTEEHKNKCKRFSGKKHSKETINKISGKNNHSFGKHRSEEVKRKISEANKGKKRSEEVKRKMSEAHSGEKNYFFGKHLSLETKRKLSESLKGEKSYLWKGGISFEPYGLEFNKDLREVIRNRDRRKCQICGKTELENGSLLDCHHIDYNKKNNNPSNLISLCKSCHCKTNHNREYWINYFE